MNGDKKHNIFDIALVVFAILYNLLIIVFSLTWVCTSYLNDIKLQILGNADPASPAYILSAFLACGAVGGASYCLKAIYERLSDAYTPNPVYTPAALIGKSPSEVFNIRVWFFWFLYRPLQSGILAMVIVSLFNQGLFSFGSTAGMNLSSIYLQLGLGFLIGYGTHEVLKKIEEIISVLFARKTENAPSPVVPKPGAAEEGNKPVVPPPPPPPPGNENPGQ